MLGLACCLGKQQKNDNLIEDDLRNLHKIEQENQLCNQPVDQSFEAPSPSARCQLENPDHPVKPRIEVIDEIVEHLKKEDVFQVILNGKRGVGKTWIAKEVAKQCILKNVVDATIWVYVDGSELLLVQGFNNLSYQLSLQEEFGGAECYLNDKDDDVDTISMKKKLNGKKVLLVSDDEISDGRVEMVTDFLEGILGSGRKTLPKVLMTKLEGTDDTITTTNDMITESDNSDNIDDSNSRTIIVNIKPLTVSESKDLLRRTWILNNTGVIRDDDVEEIVKQCNYLPAAIVFTGNMLWYGLRNEPSELTKKLAIREAKKKGGNDYWALGYEKFINNVTILKCFWLCKACRLEKGLVTYNELILYWILEGYFDESTSSQQGYANAHNVLMDLLDAGILGEREAGYVVLERAGVNLANYLFPLVCEKLPQIDYFYSKSFAHIKSGVNVRRLNGSIAAFDRTKFEGDSIVILLVRGNSISKEDSFKFSIEHDPTNAYYSVVAESLKILYVSDVELFLSLTGMTGITVLILRNCYLTNFQILKIGRILRVLDISECEMLNEISADLLTYHNHLEILNLSGSPIKYMRRPAVFLGLNELRHLFLRYTLLESFPDVNGLKELEVLDLSGAKFNPLRKKAWNLELPKLKMLDLSETRIYEFPGLVKLKNLTYLLLKNCPLLNKLRPVTTLNRLQVVVASGCRELRYFREMNLPSGNCLRKLDLSKTMIRKIPSLKNASNLVYLCLSSCNQLKELPHIEGAQNLRLLDASDAMQLEKIHTSFQDMKSLSELLLSNTKIQTLPPLSGLESLQKLDLRGCKSLRTIPENTGPLPNLFVIDLRGCIALESLLDEKFSHVTVLKD